MIPAVTVACNPKGLPIASTQSPTCTPSEFPSFAMGRSLFASIFITARSVSSSTPTTLAVYLVASPFNCTWIFVACSTTWLFVRMYPRLSTITPEPRLRSACGGPSCRPSKKRSKKSCIGSSWSYGCARRLLELCLRSSTCVVAIFTTAGSTRLTIDANELDDGITSGTDSGVAVVPANPKLFIAETRPETTDPIKIPTTSVNATKTLARILRRRAQSISSFTCSPISTSPLSWPPRPRFRQRPNSAWCQSITLLFQGGCRQISMRWSDHCPKDRGALRFLFSLLLDAATRNFVVRGDQIFAKPCNRLGSKG